VFRKNSEIPLAGESRSRAGGAWRDVSAPCGAVCVVPFDDVTSAHSNTECRIILAQFSLVAACLMQFVPPLWPSAPLIFSKSNKLFAAASGAAGLRRIYTTPCAATRSGGSGWRKDWNPSLCSRRRTRSSARAPTRTPTPRKGERCRRLHRSRGLLSAYATR
jgi:hypothetical protein